jgi:preprotein translocase subunit YajC
MGNSSSFMDFLPIIVIIGVFYFLMFRPQQQRNKRQQEMMNALEIGNEVMTAGGILGRVMSVTPAMVRLEVAPGVVVTMQKTAISTLLPPGTLDAPDNITPPPPSCCA